MIEIHAYAIVSADDRIADRDGKLPASLVNDADWRYFQSELDRCDAVVLGRASHEAAPNVRNRNRIVISSQARRIERRPDAWWWNPAEASWRDVARELLPEKSRIGVPGGQSVFDMFLRHGLTAFHLSRAKPVTLPGGRGLFAEVEEGRSADEILREHGYAPSRPKMIDDIAQIELTVWRFRLTA